MSWKKVNLGDILTESKIISENPNPDRRITVRLKVLGVEKRGLENEVEGATKQYIRKAGQFIYGKQNFHKGAFGIVPPELDGFESSSDLPAFDVDKSCLPEFIFYFFKQGNFYLELSKIASGVATQRINTTQLFELELLLPDIKTQRYLISNIQLLEKNGSEVSTELTHQLSLVKKLRQQLLQDAVQGKLVEQNKKEEPAGELLKKIKSEKQKLIAEKKLKKEKEVAPINPEEIPFEVPENWVWCRLGEISIHITDGEHVTPQKQKEGRLLLSAKNIRDGFIVYDNVDYISEEDFQKSIKRCKPEKSDVLIVSVGGTIGRSTVMNDDVEFAIVRSVALIKPFIKCMANYIKFILDSPILQKEINGRSWGTAQPCLYINQIKELTIPLPPLAEQSRIVQKLNELMQYCNELEASIKESESQNEKLLQQVLREALRKEPVGV